MQESHGGANNPSFLFSPFLPSWNLTHVVKIPVTNLSLSFSAILRGKTYPKFWVLNSVHFFYTYICIHKEHIVLICMFSICMKWYSIYFLLKFSLDMCWYISSSSFKLLYGVLLYKKTMIYPFSYWRIFKVFPFFSPYKQCRNKHSCTCLLVRDIYLGMASLSCIISILDRIFMLMVKQSDYLLRKKLSQDKYWEKQNVRNRKWNSMWLDIESYAFLNHSSFEQK